ncbi:MAG TPA: hypothetical protein VM802_28995 [Chitinophaga sp.]|uniref:hypothetical protein n=1 Tax=Chitinophaga sp. TaxID=1869181 RepID=UPI002C4A0901|nr:hypothetical protein [Chitinophaga sp.]HVI48939.1 hypothetical protein [Chitinophaga sp.]
MRYILLLIAIVSHFVSNAQQLPISSVSQIAQSLTDQQLLTPYGRDELIRFAQGEPLRAYENLDTAKLSGCKISVMIAESLVDMLPGYTNPSRQLLDALTAADRYPPDEYIEKLAEERFLQEQFPCTRDLFSFIAHIAFFYNANRGSDLSYDSSKALLVKRFGNYFGKAMIPYLQDSTIEFHVDPFTDTREQQQERVNTCRPYLQWLYAFQKSGLLPSLDQAITAYYSNGENIYGSISYTDMVRLAGLRIAYLDKYPYYKEQQLRMLDSLQDAGLIDAAGKAQIIARFTPNTLLASTDIFPYCSTAVPLCYETDIKPFDLIPREDYGQIDTSSLRSFYQLVMTKVSHALLPITVTDIRTHKLQPGTDGQYPYQRELALGSSAKLLSVTLKINDRMYKEVIDEKEFESWIRPENLQFLNHFLEDRHDNRRFFLIPSRIFTGLEKQQADTVYLAMLTEKQWLLLQTPYLFERVEGCYNGSPGDYDNAVYPGDYYTVQSRLNREQIDSFLTLCRQQRIIQARDTAFQLAGIREQNPVLYQDVLKSTPFFFTSDKQANNMLANVQQTLRACIPGNKMSFKEISSAVDKGRMVWTFTFNNKPYRFVAGDERVMFDEGTLTDAINRALTENGLPYRVYALQSSYESTLDGERYLLLKPAAANALKEKYGKIFHKEE